MLKTSEFSQVCSTSENSDVLNSQDEIYWVFTKKSKFSFYFILFYRLHAVELCVSMKLLNVKHI